MAILPIYNCFHPILKKKTEEVKEFDQNLKDLIDNMFETMYKADGVGLAANQVGVSKSVFLVDVAQLNDERASHPPVAMINPVVHSFSEEKNEFEEGCLSIPSLHEYVVRPKEIEISYYDLDMKENRVVADEFFARVIQHEFDHLNGTLFFEKISPFRRALVKSKLMRIRKGEVIKNYPMILPNGQLIEPSIDDK
jgi:peptide deformylase